MRMERSQPIMLRPTSRVAACTALLCWACSAGVQRLNAQDLSADSWRQQCGVSQCYLSISAPTLQDGTRKREGVILGIDVSKATKTAKSIAIVLPPDVSKDQDVVIGFVDGGMKQTEGGALYQLPINRCFADGCASTVAPLLDNGDGTSFDLFQALQRNSYLWVSYRANGAKDPTRAFVPIHGLKGVLNNLVTGGDSPSR